MALGTQSVIEDQILLFGFGFECSAGTGNCYACSAHQCAFQERATLPDSLLLFIRRCRVTHNNIQATDIGLRMIFAEIQAKGSETQHT